MKIFILLCSSMLIFMYFVAVSAKSVSTLNKDKKEEAWINSTAKAVVCFVTFKVDPNILTSKNDEELEKFLTNQTDICFSACLLNAFNIIRDDGSIDIKQILEDEDPKEIEKKKEELEKHLEECRPEAGTDHCKLLKCLESKES